MSGQAVIVTGSTGAGKTTTCRALIDQADDIWLHLGFDLMLGTMISSRFCDGGSRSDEAVHIAPLNRDLPDGPAGLDLGNHGFRLIQTLHDMIAAALERGQNVVVDHIATLEPPLLQDCVARLAGLPVLFVALRPDQAISAKRIDDRLDMVIGLVGREQGIITNERCKRASDHLAAAIFANPDYDLVLDSGTLAPNEIAGAILDRLEEGPGAAFRRLAERFGQVGVK